MNIGGNFSEIDGHTFDQIQPEFILILSTFSFVLTFVIVWWHSCEKLIENSSNWVEIWGEVVFFIFHNLRCHVLCWSTERGSEIIFFEIAFTHAKITDSEMSVDIDKDIFRFQVSVQHFFLVKIFHSENDLAEILFYVTHGQFLSLTAWEVEEQFTSRVVVHEEIEVITWLEASMQIYCVIVLAYFYQIFSFTELSHQILVTVFVILYWIFWYSLQGHQCSCHTTSNKVSCSICSFSQTDKKFEVCWTKFIISCWLVTIEAFEL